MAVSEIADCLCVKIHRIWRIFNYWMLQATTDEDLSGVSQLGIDATSNKKGYKYVTIFVDMAQRRVIDVHTGKGSNTITNFVEHLELQDGYRQCMY